MRLRSCVTSHFISSLEDGMVKKVHNTNSNGRPFLKLKKLKDIHQAADAMLQNGCDDTNALIETTHLPLADRKTKALNGYDLEEKDQTESSSDEDISDDLKLSQLKNRRKKRKASESVLTIKTEFDDSDLNEPLFKFKVKARKTSANKIPANESFLETAIVKVEASEMEYFEYREKIDTVDVPLVSNESATFIASESEVITINHEVKSVNSESFTNVGEICGFNFDSLDDSDTKDMVLDNEENMSNVNQSPLNVNYVEDDSTVEDMTTSTSDSSESQLTPEQVNHIYGVQDSVNADVDLNSLNSDTVPVVLDDILIVQEKSSEVNSIDNYETDMKNETSDYVEPQHMERIPSTRKAISPTSQEKLCLAMKSEELLDDMERYKCKEKLSFEEEPDNKFSSTTSEIVYNDTKADITPKTFKKPKSYKKNLASKSCLDGPRLCRSLPRLSTGCTTVEGCSESAIAFSHRQMHDIESLASKLMSELNSMKVIVEEKLLFEAYRSTSLKNEADEVKSAIKNATKTEETAKKWLSMMARDCNRFCKIMKLTEDPDLVEEKVPVEREKKKISFADEVGGRLCDIKVYEIDQTSLELKQNPES
ncbi:hypothetical protein LXL04_031589 [Taraxacum kok-saghyz]